MHHAFSRDELATGTRAITPHRTCSPIRCLFRRHRLRSSPLDATPSRLDRMSASSTPVSAPVVQCAENKKGGGGRKVGNTTKCHLHSSRLLD